MPIVTTVVGIIVFLKINLEKWVEGGGGIKRHGRSADNYFLVNRGLAATAKSASLWRYCYSHDLLVLLYAGVGSISSKWSTVLTLKWLPGT